MRIMAIDYGDARTGVAVSDETLTLAGDAWVVHSKSDKEKAQAIIDEAIKRNVSCIVVGYPKNMNGTVGPRAEKSGRFAELLRSLCGCAYEEKGAAFNIEIKLWDERMTTVSATRILNDAGKFGKNRKKAIDAVAASLILESYIGSIK